LEIRYTITIDDFHAFNEYVLFTQWKVKAVMRAVLGSMFAGTCLALTIYFSIRHIFASLITSGIVAVVVGLLWIPVERDRLRKATQKLYAKRTDTALGQQLLAINGNVVNVSSASISSVIEPSAIQTIVFTLNHCFLFLGPIKAIIIPRRELADPVGFTTALNSLVPLPEVKGKWSFGD
jgi:hypothetical protein